MHLFLTGRLTQIIWAKLTNLWISFKAWYGVYSVPLFARREIARGWNLWTINDFWGAAHARTLLCIFQGSNPFFADSFSRSKNLMWWRIFQTDLTIEWELSHDYSQLCRKPWWIWIRTCKSVYFSAITRIRKCSFSRSGRLRRSIVKKPNRPRIGKNPERIFGNHRSI